MNDLQPYLDSAAETWPELRVPEATLAQWIVERPGCSPAHAADVYLACACAQNSDRALAAFDRAYMNLVDGFVARHRLSAAALDDLKQQLRERLFVTGRIRDYSGQGALKSWLRVVAVRAVVDLERKRTELQLPDDSRPSPLAAPGEAELDFVKEAYRDAVGQALRRSLGDLASEQRNVLHLHFVDGLTLDELARLFHVHRATIARRIAAAGEAVLVEARRLFCENTRVAPAEAESLFALVRSRIELTLSSFLSAAR